MNVFIVVKYNCGNTELDALADELERVTHAVGHRPVVGWREVVQRQFTSGQEWMPFIKQCIRTCNLFILMYDESLRGGFVELGIAYAAQIPIWVLCKEGTRISNSVRGCANKIISYRDLAMASEQLRDAYCTWNTE
jgi:hypothetical protein